MFFFAVHTMRTLSGLHPPATPRLMLAVFFLLCKACFNAYEFLASHFDEYVVFAHGKPIRSIVFAKGGGGALPPNPPALLGRAGLR